MPYLAPYPPFTSFFWPTHCFHHCQGKVPGKDRKANVFVFSQPGSYIVITSFSDFQPAMVTAIPPAPVCGFILHLLCWDHDCCHGHQPHRCHCNLSHYPPTMRGVTTDLWLFYFIAFDWVSCDGSPAVYLKWLVPDEGWSLLLKSKCE